MSIAKIKPSRWANNSVNTNRMMPYEVRFRNRRKLLLPPENNWRNLVNQLLRLPLPLALSIRTRSNTNSNKSTGIPNNKERE